MEFLLMAATSCLYTTTYAHTAPCVSLTHGEGKGGEAGGNEGQKEMDGGI